MEAGQASWGFTPEVTHMLTYLSFQMLYIEDLQYYTALVLDVCVQVHVCACACLWGGCKSEDNLQVSFLRLCPPFLSETWCLIGLELTRWARLAGNQP